MRAIGIGFLAAVSVLGPTIAAAQNAAPAVRRQGAPNWSGGQLGGFNGVSSVSNGFVEPGAYICGHGSIIGVNCLETPFSFRGHPASYTIGSFVGYRWQLGEYVAGVEVDWSWKRGATSSNLHILAAPAGVEDIRSDDFTGSVAQNWDSSFRARYGYLVTPWTLVYATGGLALGQINGAFTYNGALFSTLNGANTATATSNSSWSDVRLGGTVGAGVETEVWKGWKLRAEYRYTGYGSYTKTVPVSTDCTVAIALGFPCVAPSSSATINLSESFHTIRIGLGFDF
jgi:outer membrane immunogenic protein